MKRLKKRLGKAGEILATDFLKEKGFQIIEQNYRSKHGELDVIAQEGNVLVFVEVRSRRTLQFGSPQESINISKQSQISKVAVGYLQENNLLNRPCRFDVIAITFSPDGKKPKVEHIKNAFELRGEYTY